GPALGVELGAGDLGDRDTQLTGELLDVLDDPSPLDLVRQHDLVDPTTAGEQQLAHRLAALDLRAAESAFLVALVTWTAAALVLPGPRRSRSRRAATRTLPARTSPARTLPARPTWPL